MGIVLVHSSDSKSVCPSRLYVHGGRRTVCRVLPNAAHQSIPSRRTNVVGPKLSRSDLVQDPLCHQTGREPSGCVSAACLFFFSPFIFHLKCWTLLLIYTEDCLGNLPFVRLAEHVSTTTTPASSLSMTCARQAPPKKWRNFLHWFVT
jgi:hypothetical protein